MSFQIFFFFLPENYVEGTHLKCLSEALLMSTHNMCFHIERRISTTFGCKKHLIWGYAPGLRIFWAMQKCVDHDQLVGSCNPIWVFKFHKHRPKCTDSEHPAYAQSIILAFALHSYKYYVVFNDSGSGEWRPLSDWTATFSLGRAHIF